MSRNKISTTIYVTPEQNDRLKLLHERTKVPVAVYIREGIDLVLNQYANLLPGQLALGRPISGPSSGSGSGSASSESRGAPDAATSLFGSIGTAVESRERSAEANRRHGSSDAHAAGDGSVAAADPLANDGTRAKK
jgi:predicted DNA-binding protein